MKNSATRPSFGPPQLHVAGDMGILVEFGSEYAPQINAAVIAFDQALDLSLPAGVIETVPTFRSLLVRFDPLNLAFEALNERLLELLASQNWYQVEAPVSRQRWVLPVVYGGSRGADLGEVADLMGLREDQVIDGHAAQDFSVAMLGFSPGLAYLGQLPERWDFPRRTSINPKVPAGAILVAVRQTVLPCTDIPTGWRQIGQTPFRSFNAKAKTPFLLSPGDQVRFEPVREAAYLAYDMADVLRKVGG